MKIISVLLASMLVISGPYSVISTSSAFDQTNSTQIPIPVTTNSTQIPIPVTTNSTQIPIPVTTNSTQIPIPVTTNSTQIPIPVTTNSTQIPIPVTTNSTQIPIPVTTNSTQIPIPVTTNSTSQTKSNGTKLSVHNNAVQLANNQYIVLLPKYNNTIHASAPFSKSKLVVHDGKLASMGAMLRNDGYCFPYAFFGETGCGNLQYNNGPVMHNAKILLIFWLGSSYSGNCSTSHYFESPTNDPTATNPNDCSYMNLQVQFLKDMCSDPFMKLAAQYTDISGGAGPCTVYANVGNPWIDTNSFPHNPILDVDLQAESAKMLARMNLHASLNTEVFIFTPYGIDSCINASGVNCFSNSFCAYHAGFGTTNYANMPDVAAGDCGPVFSPNNDPVADQEINPLSHELMESLTDPSYSGWMYNMMLDHEIADQCAYDYLVTVNPDNSTVHFGINGNPYFIQSEWSNSNGGCALTEQSLPLPPSNPPTDLTATALSSNSIMVSWNGSSGATSYNVFHSTSPTGPFIVPVGTSSATSFTDTGLSQDTRYYYEMTASNTGGTSTMSNTQAFALTNTSSTSIVTLLNIYNSRADLQSAYPEAANGVNIANLLGWAGSAGISIDSASSILLPYASFYSVMSVYHNRADLQSAYPEAANGANIANLLGWAGTSGISIDSASSTLSPYAPTYKLMQVYNSRSDLQSAFPEAANMANIKNLLTWAGTSGISIDSASSTLSPYAPTYKLMQVYNSRSDLQAAFPEAANNGNTASLLCWAKNSGISIDSASSVLSAFASFYNSHC